MKGKALRRALQTKEAYRIDSAVPLIIDTTEFITPEKAQEYLQKNTFNRPVNWRRVEEYADLMSAGKWQLTPQGIVFADDGKLLTGQNRLWAVVYSGTTGVYMRVSRGTLNDAANVLDRGQPQSARDLASRVTGKKHSPVEASIARCILALKGTPKPDKDKLAEEIEIENSSMQNIFEISAGTKKTKSIIMILAAICYESKNADTAKTLTKSLEFSAARLDDSLKPLSVAQCWNKGAAFVLAMEKARSIIHDAKDKIEER